MCYLPYLLAYHLRSRKVDNDFDKLCDLIVSDRLKVALPYGPLNYCVVTGGRRETIGITQTELLLCQTFM